MNINKHEYFGKSEELTDGLTQLKIPKQLNG